MTASTREPDIQDFNFEAVRLLANDHSLSVGVAGQAGNPAVILLHHGLGSRQSWLGTIPALASAGYRVIAYDRWGYGQSQSRQTLGMPFFNDDLKDLRAICDQLELKPVSLVGHSDGGTIALYFSALYPERVAALVVVAAHVYVEQKMESGILGVRTAYERDERFRAGLRRLHGEQAQQVFYNWFDGWRREENLNWDMRPQLGRITSPALVIQGLEDEHATPQHARDIVASIPKAELWLVPGARHMLPQEMPDEFNRRIISFITRSAGA
jgi:pimeloyl-ACP methyl ester carboxylesterase